MNFLLQIVIFALISTIVGMAVSTPMMMTDPKFKLSEYRFWPAVAASYFLAAAITFAAVKSYPVLNESLLRA